MVQTTIWVLKMQAVYILNDSCFYRRLCWFSISMIRHYNKTIPIQILYICDNGRDHREIVNYNEADLGIPWFTREMFFEEISKFNVQLNIVNDCDLGEENGFFCAQRQELVKVNGEDNLLIDCDTFIFDDIEPLFENLKYFDIIADKNEWGVHGGNLDIDGTFIYPFNSGVVLFKKDLLQQYGAVVNEISLEIKHERNDIGKWYGEFLESKNENRLEKPAREEIAFTCWVVKNNFKYRYFDPTEVQTVKLNSNTRIYHTMTQNWFDGWSKYFKGGKFCPPKKLHKRLFLKRK